MRRLPPGLPRPLRAAAYVTALLWPLAVLGLEDPERRHALDELASRSGGKPYDVLVGADGYPAERTVFSDTVTGAELWRLTHEPGDDRHVYYDVPAWSLDGRWMLIMHGSGLVDRYWLVDSASGELRPLGDGTGSDLALDEISGESFSGEVFWSWLDVDRLYSLKRGIVYRWQLSTAEKVEVFDLEAATGIAGEVFRIQPPHPGDDRLLFHTRDRGRFFSLDVGTLELVEFPGDGRWAVPDGIHRLRWMKDPEHEVLIGQNYALEDGLAVIAPVQYRARFDGTLIECNAEGFDQRGGHPDTLAEGGWISGNYDGEIWLTDCPGGELDRRIYDALTYHHASNTFDGRWHVADNSPPTGAEQPPEIGGFGVVDSLVLSSLDGRAQMVLAYHYSSYAQDENAHPAPVASPDGTKLMFDSDMLERGVFQGAASGDADVWVAVLRPPSPPRGVRASAVGGAVQIDWQRPLHAPAELYWNLGNQALEIAGYTVLRSGASGGPYEVLHDGLVAGTRYVDTGVEPGVSYYYAVRAVEASGLASGPSAEVHGASDGIAWRGPFRLYAEAEQGAVARPMVLQTDWREASGGWLAGTFAAEPDPAFPLEPYPARVAVAVAVPAPAEATVWARVAGRGGAGSFDVSVGGVAAGALPVPDGPWRWERLAATVSLGPGEREVELATSDPGIGVDLVLVTDDPSFTPPPRGNGDAAAPSPPSEGEIVDLGGGVRKVLWTPSPDRDVRHYNLYCGRDAGYLPDNRRLLLSPTLPEALDWGIPEGWETVYMVTAVDRSGNESQPLVLDPAVIGTGAGPVASDDLFTVVEDTLLDLPAPGVLANDEDADGDPLTAILLADVERGSLALAADGSLTYQPDPEDSGTVSFTYKVSDGRADSRQATVSLEIEAVNDPPATLPDSYTVTEDKLLNVGDRTGLLANDADAEGDPITAALAGPPALGVATVLPDGSFTYAAPADFNGTVTFTYVASDGVGSSPPTLVTVTVTAVDDPPVAINDSIPAVEDGILRLRPPGVLANDIEVDGETLTATLVGGVGQGVVSLRADGAVLYRPAPDFFGVDSFAYRVSDGHTESETATVQLVVANVNDAPVADSESYPAVEDTALTVDATSGVLAGDTDADDDHLTAVLVAGASHGTVSLVPTGAFTYTPAADYAGSDSFTYQASDGELLSAPATVSLTVAAINDAPVAVADLSYAALEDTPLVVAAPGVLANDSDVDGDPLSAVLATPPVTGSVDLRADGGFTYIPAAELSGLDSFTYFASDGQADSAAVTVRVTVAEVNDPPVALADAYAVAEDGALSVDPQAGVLANDTDADGDSLSAVLVTTTDHGTLTLNGTGSLTYRPVPNFNGADRLEYLADDGADTSAPATVSLTVVAVNDLPVAVADSFSGVEEALLEIAAPGPLANDTDVDLDPLTAVLVGAPAHGALDLRADGSFSYLPEDGFFGSDSFTYRASDGAGESQSVSVTLTVAGTQDPPITLPDLYAVAAGGLLDVGKTLGVLANDVDPDGDPLSAALADAPARGTLVLRSNGSLVYRPEVGFVGPVTFTYRASDGIAQSPPTLVTIDVLP